MRSAGPMSDPPLETKLVDAIREALAALGIANESGRIYTGGRPPFLPILGPGTPDILLWIHQRRTDGLNPRTVSAAEMHGIEAKRTLSDKARASQVAWHERWGRIGVRVTVVSTVADAVRFAKEQMR